MKRKKAKKRSNKYGGNFIIDKSKDAKLLHEVLDSETHNGGYFPKGLGKQYLHKGKNKFGKTIYTALDNTDGDAWTEDFTSRSKAIAYLNGKSFTELAEDNIFSKIYYFFKDLFDPRS